MQWISKDAHGNKSVSSPGEINIAGRETVSRPIPVVTTGSHSALSFCRGRSFRPPERVVTVERAPR